jgi:LPS export ABC transporter protein LptC
MHMIETQEGRKEWELWSDKATSLKAKELLQLETVKAIFFSDSGVTFTVTGRQGLVQVKSKNLRVEGDVVTRSSNGYTFRSEVMEYDSAGRTLSAPSHVEMFGPRDHEGHSLHLTGVGMKASLPQSSMEILSDVKAEKGLDKGRKALITSHRSIFSGKDKTAKFMDDVVLDLDSMRITGPEARFDYDSKSDTVKSVYVSGGARVSDADKWATAQNVNIDFKSEKFIFRGSPRVVQNNDELRGDEIVFLDGGKQVLVQKARAKVDERRLEKKK